MELEEGPELELGLVVVPTRRTVVDSLLSSLSLTSLPPRVENNVPTIPASTPIIKTKAAKMYPGFCLRQGAACIVGVVLEDESSSLRASGIRVA